MVLINHIVLSSGHPVILSSCIISIFVSTLLLSNYLTDRLTDLNTTQDLKVCFADKYNKSSVIFHNK